jgi:hypothetical protein
MNNLSLQITLNGSGEQKTFPLHSRAAEYFQGRNWHEFVSLGINNIDNIHLEQFTNTDCGMLWEIISGNYVEGQTTSDDINWEEEDDVAGCHLTWQILIDGKPASYAEVDQSLNCDFWLHIKSSRQTEGDWSSIPLHKTENGLDISDGIYEAAEVDHENGTEEDGTHYGQVLEAIEPILNRTTDYVKTTIDGINYEFSLSRCEDFYS